MRSVIVYHIGLVPSCFNVQTDDLTNRFQQEVATLYGTWILIQSDTGESITG